MSEIQAFLQDAAVLTVVSMDDKEQSFVLRLEREIRFRDPGLCFMPRKQFGDYQWEGAGAPSSFGEQTLTLLGIIRNSSRFGVVLANRER